MILTAGTSVEGINLTAELFDAVGSGNMEEYLLLVPTNRRARALTKELLNDAGSGLTSLTIGTIVSLFTSLHAEIEPGVKPLSDAAASLLVKKALQRLRAGYFKGYTAGAPQGTIDKIRRVFSEFKRRGVTASLIAGEWGEASANAEAKAVALAELFEMYVNDCRTQKFAEPGDSYRSLIAAGEEQVIEAFRKIYPKVKRIILLGYSEFTAPEAELLRRTAGAVEGGMVIELDYHAANHALFGILQSSVELLAKYGFSEVTDRSLAEQSHWVNGLKSALFSEAAIQMHSYAAGMQVLSALSKHAEAGFIADTIKGLILQGKAAPHEIAVVFNIINDYSALIRDQFAIRGIPLNLTDRYFAGSVPSAVAILRLLEVEENDWYFKDVLRTFGEPLLPFMHVPLAAVRQVASGRRLLRGKQYWFSAIGSERQEALLAGDERKAAALSRVQQALEKLELWLAPLHGRITPGQFLDGVTGVIARSGINMRVTGLPKEVLEINLRALHAFLDAAREVSAIITLERPETREHLSFYLNQVRTALQAVRVNTAEKPGFGVSVTTLDELRGLSFKYLFIGGLYEGNLPSRFQPEIFLADAYAEQERTHRGREQYLYYQALRSWAKGLWLTSPRQEEKAELQQSSFLTEICRLTGLSAVSVPAAPVYSSFSLLVEAGAELRAKREGSACNELPGPVRKRVVEAVTVDLGRKTEDVGIVAAHKGVISGNLSDEALLKLAQLRERLFSISQLEVYAKCPFKYFAERILFLQEMKDPAEEVDALEMGSVLHAVLESFYSQLVARGIDLRAAPAATLTEAYALLFEIARTKINELGLPEFIIFWEREKLLGINGDQSRSLLHMFWEHELLETGFAPKALEAAFGDSGASPQIEYHGIQLRGKIDRIDIADDEKLFRIVDYKRGNGLPDKGSIAEGVSLQLPVYLYAGSQLLQSRYGITPDPVEPVIYSLKFSEEEFGPYRIMASGNKMLNGAHLEADALAVLSANARDVMQLGLNKLEEFVNGISTGVFHVSTHKDREAKVCKYCHLAPVCRVKDTD